MVLLSVEQVLMFNGFFYISGTEHNNYEVKIQYANLSGTYKQYGPIARSKFNAGLN